MSDTIDADGLEEWLGEAPAPGGQGDYADEWNNKPHRLIYDASREIERLTAIIQQMEQNFMEIPNE